MHTWLASCRGQSLAQLAAFWSRFIPGGSLFPLPEAMGHCGQVLQPSLHFLVSKNGANNI